MKLYIWGTKEARAVIGAMAENEETALQKVNEWLAKEHKGESVLASVWRILGKDDVLWIEE